jgi:hypothetical protein
MHERLWWGCLGELGLAVTGHYGRSLTGSSGLVVVVVVTVQTEVVVLVWKRPARVLRREHSLRVLSTYR